MSAAARQCNAGPDRAQRPPPAPSAFGISEAGLDAGAGIPTVVCGPGDIGRAHKADEWIGSTNSPRPTA